MYVLANCSIYKILGNNKEPTLNSTQFLQLIVIIELCYLSIKNK